MTTEEPQGPREQLVTTELVRTRKVIMDRLWSGLADAGSNPARIVEEAGRAIEELQRLLERVAPSEDMLQVGRTWKYLGDAWYSRFLGNDPQSLAGARAAYERSLGFLERADDELQLAKAQVNLANTLLQISGGSDRPLLEEAKAHYRRAIEVLVRRLPGEVTPVRRSLWAVLIALKQTGGGDVAPAEPEGYQDSKADLERDQGPR